jgi:hypothetical protein
MKGKALTIFVELKPGSEPVVRYETYMGKLNTVEVEHATGLKRFGRLTPSDAGLWLIAANIPDLPNAYHRVRWSTIRHCYICSCNNGPNCEHCEPITQSA